LYAMLVVHRRLIVAQCLLRHVMFPSCIFFVVVSGDTHSPHIFATFCNTRLYNFFLKFVCTQLVFLMS